MSSTNDKPLRFALLLVGLIFLIGLYPLTVLWPAGFMWEPRQSEYEQMIIGVYAVLEDVAAVADMAKEGINSLPPPHTATSSCSSN